MKKKCNITILGAGSWGIALAQHMSQIGHRVIMWEFDQKAATDLQISRRRESVMPDVTLQPNILVTSDLQTAITGADLVFLVMPSHVTRSVIKRLSAYSDLKSSKIISCIKGIENDSLMRISEILEYEIPDFPMKNYAVLSGPSHAEEVSRKIPTAVVIASLNKRTARYVQNALNNASFRLYTSNDIIGVELGGALKNVIAIAAGICDGAGFGDNTKAALQPRGLAEIARLGRKLGADPLTFMGLSGMGDLIVTCMSRHSRNRYVGEQIGKGKSLSEVLESMAMVAEGVKTCKSAFDLAKKHKVEMPICRQVYDILFKGISPADAVTALMQREVKPEVW